MPVRGLGLRHVRAASREVAEPESTYNGAMNTIHLTDAELEMARHALRAYSLAFGHDEADTLAEINRVIVKLRAAEHEPEVEDSIA